MEAGVLSIITAKVLYLSAEWSDDADRGLLDDLNTRESNSLV